MVSLLAVFSVKAEERCHTLKSAGRGSNQLRRRNLTNSLEEATRNAKPPPVIAAEMDVEQPREQPLTCGASSSSALAQSGQEAAPLLSSSTHEVLMETAEPSSSTRPLEGGDESSSKRVRSLAGMLLFDGHDASD